MMIYRYIDPERDADAYFTAQTAAQEKWERENYAGKCPACGKPMFHGAISAMENAVLDDETDDYYHETCLQILNWDREEAVV